MQLENNTLYYIYDPMCSWCYAFEHSLASLQQQLPNELNFKSILGGLAKDSEDPMPIETQTMIQQAWQRIEKTVPTIKFNFDFWTKNTPYRSTYPACRAILAAENQSFSYSEPMRKAIQHAYYQEAKNPSLVAVLMDCATQLKLDMPQFNDDLVSTAINEKLKGQRQFSLLLGINSYPSLNLAINGKVYPLIINYNEIDDTLKQINTLLK